MGLTGANLHQYVTDQQTIEREDSQKERELKREEQEAAERASKEKDEEAERKKVAAERERHVLEIKKTRTRSGENYRHVRQSRPY